MVMKKLNNKGFGVLEAFVLAAVLGFVGGMIFQAKNDWISVYLEKTPMTQELIKNG